jgi:hypothetical protein
MRLLNSLGVLQLCNPDFIQTFDELYLYEDFGDSFLHLTTDATDYTTSTLVDLEKKLLKSFFYNNKKPADANPNENQKLIGAVVDRIELDNALEKRLIELGKCKIYKDQVPKEVWRHEHGI